MIPREPLGPVQLAPAGLLGLLQLKTGGFNPDALRQDIQPTVEVGPYWLRAAYKTITDGYSRTDVGNGNEIDILLDTLTGARTLGPPADQWWYVHHVTMACFSDTNSTTDVGVGMRLPGGPGSTLADLVVGDTFDVAANATEQRSARDFWMPPGSFLGFWFGVAGAGGSINVNLVGMQYTALQV